MKPRDWLSRFEGRRERLAADLASLVGLESPSEDAACVSSLALWIRDRLRERGVAAEIRPCPGRGDALVAGAGNGAGGVLILGHLDTVWARGTLDEFPYRVEGDRASGPGVFDMKAGIAVAMDVMAELAKERAGDATLLLVPDEEIGSGASRALTLELAGRHRSVLVVEPSLDGAAKVARKGHGLLRLRFRGRAAHAGLDPDRGASALVELARCVLFLESLADRPRDTTVAATVAKSGDKTNVIPEDGELSVDVRVWAADEARRVEQAVRAYRPADPRVVVEMEGGVDRPPMESTADSLALYEQARSVAAQLGFELGAARVGGASDGNFTAAAGIPTLDGLGPMGGNAHARGEFVSLADLPRRAALLAVLAAGA